MERYVFCSGSCGLHVDLLLYHEVFNDDLTHFTIRFDVLEINLGPCYTMRLQYVPFDRRFKQNFFLQRGFETLAAVRDCESDRRKCLPSTSLLCVQDYGSKQGHTHPWEPVLDFLHRLGHHWRKDYYARSVCFLPGHNWNHFNFSGWSWCWKEEFATKTIKSSPARVWLGVRHLWNRSHNSGSYYC